MPTIPLATLARAKGIRRPAVALRPITTTSAQANELAAIIMPIINHWQAAQADILRGYVLPTQDGLGYASDTGSAGLLGDKGRLPERASQQSAGTVLPATITDNANDMQGAIDRAANEAARLVLVITPRLRDWLVKIEKYQRGKWIGSVLTATNIDLGTILTALPVQDTLESWLARNVALIRDISREAENRIADVVFRNYQQRTPITKVAKEMRESVAMSRQRAIRIAGDQTKKIAAQLNRERRLEAGVDQYKYRHSGKAHPRKEHVVRDGYIYDESGNSTNGGPFIPASDRAGFAPFCGCQEQAWLSIMSELE